MSMKGSIQDLDSRTQTGTSIYESAKYFKDLGPYLDTSLQQFFNFVREIPYLEDNNDIEITSRPKFLLQRRYKIKGLDCKKKATLIGAWLNAHGIPWRLAAISERPDKVIHHVFVQAKIDGEYKSIDPTFPEFTLFEPKENVTYGELLLS